LSNSDYLATESGTVLALILIFFIKHRAFLVNWILFPTGATVPKNEVLLTEAVWKCTEWKSWSIALFRNQAKIVKIKKRVILRDFLLLRLIVFITYNLFEIKNITYNSFYVLVGLIGVLILLWTYYWTWTFMFEPMLVRHGHICLNLCLRDYWIWCWTCMFESMLVRLLNLMFAEMNFSCNVI
jgi:hypothetical protein